MLQEALHDSRQPRYRSPQGALQAGKEVRLALQVSGRLRFASADLRLWIQGREQLIPMHLSWEGERAYFTAMARMPEQPGLVWYYFIVRLPGDEVLNYGGQSGSGALYPHEPPGYQITIYDGAFETPRWFREGVLYQIFPDRFKKTGDISGGVAYHRGLGRTVRLHENWNEQPAYTPENGQPHYRPNDFFGGTLLGIQQQLPYLQSLGVSCVYMNPIFESASNHRYDTGDYMRVDPILGDNESLRRLCAEAGGKGIRLMLDGVFSHTGADSIYFNKYNRYKAMGAYQGEHSPTRSWYHFDTMYQSGYRSWWGFTELPEVEESSEAYMDFILGKKDSLLAHWAAHGIAGWRLDVADELPDSFIVKLRAALKELNPEAVLLGEVWEDASNKEAYGVRREYVLGHELDSVMNYPFRSAVLGFLLGETDAFALNHILQMQREHYPKPFYYACMNMLSTHDSPRALTVLSGAPQDGTREQQSMYTPSPEAYALAKKRLILAAALQMAMPGVPCIYYGDEAGCTGMKDPFNRGTYPWGQEDMELLAAYRALANARAQNGALRAGFCRMGAPRPDVFVVLRYTVAQKDAFDNPAPDAAALLLCNRGGQSYTLMLSAEDLREGQDAEQPVSLTGDWQDACTGQTLHIENRLLQLELPPLTAMLLLRQ